MRWRPILRIQILGIFQLLLQAPAQRKPSPKPLSLEVAPKSSAISSLSAPFERPKETIIPKSSKVSPENNKAKFQVNSKGSIAPVSSKIETPTKDSKEGEARFPL